MTTGLEIRLASRPHGWPTMDNFDLVEADVPAPQPGQVLVRNLVMSVDPYMRGRMSDAKSYAPPYEVGKVMHGGAVGEVVESTVDSPRPGDIVLHGLGWREYAVVDAAQTTVVDLSLAPAGAYLGVLGMTGLTAYAGLVEVAAFQPGDTVFVSGAAGAVGSVVGQIARLKGAKRVIGSAGSAAKVTHLIDELGFDTAFNYKDGPVAAQLAEAAPDGIEVYFDNVGGEHLEAAVGALNVHGRVAVCGMISQYNATTPSPAPRNLSEIVKKRLTIRGMLVSDHAHLRDQFVREVGGWLREGKLRYQETVVAGLANAPEAFLAMMRGENTGKMLVTVP
ncbi:MAG TPA: NADP-dependent oxidoreductase, partial [Pseudonocardiaceae bacterium]|nr:NADP-dependent oxidoreductase [Pseudonocardiaceae bacterium]